MADINNINKKRKNEWMIKSDMELKLKLDAIRRERIKRDLDENMTGYNDILKASFRFEPLLDILRKAKIEKKNKKAQTSAFNIFIFMVAAFMAVVIFAGLIYTMGLINDVMHNAGLVNEINAGKPSYTNMTKAADDIFGQAYDSIKALRIVAIVYILGLATCIILTSALQRVHPIWFFAYMLIALLAVITSPIISNSYETILGTNIYAGELNNFQASNFMILNLPIIVMVISTLGSIFLFIGLIRSQQEVSL